MINKHQYNVLEQLANGTFVITGMKVLRVLHSLKELGLVDHIYDINSKGLEAIRLFTEEK